MFLKYWVVNCVPKDSEKDTEPVVFSVVLVERLQLNLFIGKIFTNLSQTFNTLGVGVVSQNERGEAYERHGLQRASSPAFL